MPFCRRTGEGRRFLEVVHLRSKSIQSELDSSEIMSRVEISLFKEETGVSQEELSNRI